MTLKAPVVVLCSFFSLNLLLTLITLGSYQGNPFVYLLFSLLLNILLYLGLRTDSIFFDTFIGGLFWLGYWLKFSIRTSFMEGRFHEFVGYFDYSGAGFDHALLATSCGVSGLIGARLIRARFCFTYVSSENLSRIRKFAFEPLFDFYRENKKVILIGFVALILFTALTNMYFGFYQRGSIPRTVLPYGLGGIYTWLLLFGLASISAVLIHMEFRLRERVSFAVILIVLMELLLSNISLLSRGMILNGSALLVGVYAFSRISRSRFRVLDVSVTLVAFVLLFVASVVAVNTMRDYFRAAQFESREEMEEWRKTTGDPEVYRAEHFKTDTKVLFLDRWVGMEGILAVSSYPEPGWELWREAWREEFVRWGSSLYDRKIAKSPVADLDLSHYHFISMPGILAFFYYPGSYLFLFFAMILVGALAAAIEFLTFRFGGANLILCSLIGFVVAYRFAHFGYAPSRSYVLGGAIVLNVALIFLSNYLLSFRYRSNVC